MAAMQSTDNNFVPKVWQDHIHAYFDRKLVMGQLALVDRTLQAQPGTTLNFPYFSAIGAVETPAQDEGLTVDKLTDNAFSVTISEIGKAVGYKDAAKRSSSQPGAIDSELQAQIARVYAEKVDQDLMAIMDSRNAAGYVATASGDKMNIRTLLKSKVAAFGDKHDHAKVCIMHSSDYVNLMTDTTSGFLQANANSPYAMINGYMGDILNMALIVVDTVPQGANIGGQVAYGHYFLKENPFGIYMAEDLKLEQARNILARETVTSSTMWYGVLSLHGQVNSLDKRVGRGYCPIA
jgi:hypothetical protein